jgi:hypothetical protein
MAVAIFIRHRTPSRLASWEAGRIIHIRFSHDLPTRNQNKLRYRMELAEWKRAWRAAEAAGDMLMLDRLHSSYEMVGLP